MRRQARLAVNSDYTGLPFGIDKPKVGAVWYQSIDQIMQEWASTDGASPGCMGEWTSLLEEKREDDHYPDIVKSLKRHGFVRPATCWFDRCGGLMVYGDGNHRLAASIDLGWTHVLVQRKRGAWIHSDSGFWTMDEPIPID
jgi:hypothetical protein